MCLISQNRRMPPVHSNTERLTPRYACVCTHTLLEHTRTGDFHSMSCQSSAMLEENVHGTRPTAWDEARGDLGASTPPVPPAPTLTCSPLSPLLPFCPGSPISP